MPLYEFECSECGASFERVCSIGLEVSDCSCGASARRIISVPAPPVIAGPGGTGERWVNKQRFDWDPNKSLSPEGKAMWRQAHRKSPHGRVYEMDFGRAERDRLAKKADALRE